MRMGLAIITAVATLASSAAQSETIKLATGNDYKPFTDEGLPAGGMVTEIVRTAYQKAGHNVSIEFMPWKRAERAVQQGDVVAIFPYVKTEERLKKYAYSDTVYVTKVVPVVNKDSIGEIKSSEDLEGKKTCYPVGWSVGIDAIDKMFENEEVDVTRSRGMPSCYKMLARGRIDFIPIERASGMIDAKSALGSLENVHFENVVFGSTNLHLIFDKDGKATPGEIRTFNDALDAIKEDGTHESIVKKHIE